MALPGGDRLGNRHCAPAPRGIHKLKRTIIMNLSREGSNST
jgi:hypothetical protein